MSLKSVHDGTSAPVGRERVRGGERRRVGGWSEAGLINSRRTGHSARLTIHDEEWHSDAPRRVQRSQFERLVLRLALHFVAPVLEPDFDLLRRQLQRLRQMFPLWGRQIALLLEASLQLVDLSL